MFAGILFDVCKVVSRSALMAAPPLLDPMTLPACRIGNTSDLVSFLCMKTKATTILMLGMLRWWPSVSLQWCHNGRDGVSNLQPHDCLLNRLFGRSSKKTSKLCVTGLCEGNSPVTGEFPHPRLQFCTFHDSMIWTNLWCDWINWIINAVRIFYIREKYIFTEELITHWISAPACLVLVSVIYTYIKCRFWPVTHIRGKKANGFHYLAWFEI